MTKSTVTAVRALGWASAVLGMPAPSVFADPQRDVGYAHVPAMPPWSLLGKRVLSGCMPREHPSVRGEDVTASASNWPDVASGATAVSGTA